MRGPLVIIDDEPSIREALELVFDGRFEVRAFASAEDALAMPDGDGGTVGVVFLDGNLGRGMDGEQALPLLKAKFPGASVVFMGSQGAQRRDQLLAGGVALVLPKPWKLEDLRAAAELRAAS